MKKSVIAIAAVLGALALGGCAQNGTPTVNTQSIQTVVSEVVAGVKTTCDYAPVATDISKVVANATGNAGAIAGTALADNLVTQICGELKNKASVHRGAAAEETITVEGVLVHAKKI